MFKKHPLPLTSNTNAELYLSNSINSNCDNFRLLIRKEIYKFLQKQGLANESLQDLSISPPKLADISLSISHCSLGSVFAYALNSQPLGVDLEDKSRLSDQIIVRISDDEERALSPIPNLLFSAKEALWKAIASSPWAVPTISQIKITQWESVDEKTWQYRACMQEKQIPGSGTIQLLPQTTLALYSL